MKGPARSDLLVFVSTMKNNFVFTTDEDVRNELANRGFALVGIRDHAWYFMNDTKLNFDNLPTNKMSFTNIMPV